MIKFYFANSKLREKRILLKVLKGNYQPSKCRIKALVPNEHAPVRLYV